MSEETLKRIARALERLASPPPLPPDFSTADAFLWHSNPQMLSPVPKVSRVSLDLLLGISWARDTLLENTKRFAKGLPANNALLWGARGMGKSSLVKAVHAAVRGVKLIELQREDLSTLSVLLDILNTAPDFQFLLFCDDLSFGYDDTAYKSLKAILDGGVMGRPRNVIFYATSNRRHLMSRDMIENEQQNGINPSEAVEEKLSLSDRFGLWLGFHACDQKTYLDIIRGYCDYFSVEISDDILYAEAIEWQATRGARSGRVAWQYFCDLAGRKGIKLF